MFEYYSEGNMGSNRPIFGILALLLLALLPTASQGIACYQCGDNANGYKCGDNQSGSDAKYGQCDETLGSAILCVERRYDDNSLHKGCYTLCGNPNVADLETTEAPGQMIGITHEVPVPGTTIRSITEIFFGTGEEKEARQNNGNDIVGSLNGGCVSYQGGFDCFCHKNGCNNKCPYKC